METYANVVVEGFFLVCFVVACVFIVASIVLLIKWRHLELAIKWGGPSPKIRKKVEKQVKKRFDWAHRNIELSRELVMANVILRQSSSIQKFALMVKIAMLSINTKIMERKMLAPMKVYTF